MLIIGELHSLRPSVGQSVVGPVVRLPGHLSLLGAFVLTYVLICPKIASLRKCLIFN